MGKKFIVEIKDHCPSWNTLYAGKHWAVRKKMADEKHELVFWSVKASKRPKLPFKGVVVAFYEIWFKDKRRHDFDNLLLKMYNDGLVHAGVFDDDDSKHLVCGGIYPRTGMSEDKIIIRMEEI